MTRWLVSEQHSRRSALAFGKGQKGNPHNQKGENNRMDTLSCSFVSFTPDSRSEMRVSEGDVLHLALHDAGHPRSYLSQVTVHEKVLSSSPKVSVSQMSSAKRTCSSLCDATPPWIR